MGSRRNAKATVAITEKEEKADGLVLNTKTKCTKQKYKLRLKNISQFYSLFYTNNIY